MSFIPVRVEAKQRVGRRNRAGLYKRVGNISEKKIVLSGKNSEICYRIIQSSFLGGGGTDGLDLLILLHLF